MIYLKLQCKFYLQSTDFFALLVWASCIHLSQTFSCSDHSDVFRTQSKIYDGAFLWKYLTAKSLTIFAKKLHRRSSIGFSIHLWAILFLFGSREPLRKSIQCINQSISVVTWIFFSWYIIRLEIPLLDFLHMGTNKLLPFFLSLFYPLQPWFYLPKFGITRCWICGELTWRI